MDGQTSLSGQNTLNSLDPRAPPLHDQIGHDVITVQRIILFSSPLCSLCSSLLRCVPSLLRCVPYLVFYFSSPMCSLFSVLLRMFAPVWENAELRSTLMYMTFCNWIEETGHSVCVERKTFPGVFQVSDSKNPNSCSPFPLLLCPLVELYKKLFCQLTLE